MAKKFKIATLEETQEELKIFNEFTKKFNGFKIPPNFKDEVEAASVLLENGREREAIEATQSITRRIRANLVRFFKRSYIHFENLRSQLECKILLDKDIAKHLDKVLSEEKTYANLQIGIDLDKAQELYSAAQEALCSAEKEQRMRNQARRKRREEENKLIDAQHAEEQRKIEQDRRLKKAEDLRTLANLMNI